MAVTPEAKARLAIDEKLEACGYVVQDVEEFNPTASLGVVGERKAKMVELGDAFVALPGGVGTLEEISEIMSRIRLGFDPAECFLLNIDGFYNPLRALLDAMLAQGFLTQADLDRFHFPENVAELTRPIETAGERKPLRQATARELDPSAE